MPNFAQLPRNVSAAPPPFYRLSVAAALSPSELDALTHSSEVKGGVAEREGEVEGEEDPLCQSTEDEVGKMLRSTLTDLETALEVGLRQILHYIIMFHNDVIGERDYFSGCRSHGNF